MATKKTAKKAVAKKVPAKAKAPAAKASVTDLIKATYKTFSAAVATGDAVAIGKLYTKTAKLLPPGHPACKGTKAITAFWQSALASGIKGAKLKPAEVSASGTTAIEVGTYSLTVEGGAVADVGKYIVIWKKEGREWKLDRDIFNSDGTVQAAAASS